MKSKLHQVVAVVKDSKTRFQDRITQIYQSFGKPDSMSGFSKNFTPVNENTPLAEVPPSENKRITSTVKDSVNSLVDPFVQCFDTVLNQELGNQTASGDISVTVGTRSLSLSRLPASYLLFLEKKAVDILTFIEKMPVLEAGYNWTFDPATNQYRSDTVESFTTRKIQEPIVLFPATVEHPAQCQLITKDVNFARAATTRYSGAISLQEKEAMLSRGRAFLDAVKVARQEANQQTVESRQVGASIFQFIFG